MTFWSTTQKVYRLLNTTVQPWGFFHYNEGQSMEPTLGGNPGILYSSHAYIDRDDLKVGDVVMVLDIDFDAKRGGIVKRIAGLEGDRLWVTTGRYRTPYILLLKTGRCFVLGDNPSKSGDSRYFRDLPIEAIWSKCRWRWGLDGFQWINHNEHPWLKNKVIQHLAPGQNRPIQDGPLIKQPRRK